MLTPKSRDEIFDDMQSYLQSLAPALTDFNIGSVLNSILDAPAAGMEQLWNALIASFDAIYVSTATGEDLDNKVADFGLTRKAATYATGYVTFGRSTPYSQDFAIPAGTTIQTPSSATESGVSFTTNQDAILPANQQFVSSVPIIAVQAGVAGNAAADQIIVLSSPPSGIETVSNPAATAGGTDQETDEALRARVPLYLSSLARGTKASLESAALSVSGVSSVSILENIPTPGWVEVYIADASGTATNQMIADVQVKMEEYRPVAVMVTTLAPIVMNIDVSANIGVDAGYSATEVKADVATAITDFLGRQTLGELVFRSELISAITIVDGVTYVNTQVPFYDGSYGPRNCSLSASTIKDPETSVSFNIVQLDQTPYEVDSIYLAYDLEEVGTNFYTGGSITKREVSLGTNLPIVNEELTTTNGGIQDLNTIVLIYATDVGTFPTTPVIAPPYDIDSNGIWLAVDAFVFGNVVFTGAGLNDMTTGGTYTDTTFRHYVIQVDYAGAPADTFKWSDDGGISFSAELVPMTGGAQTLSYGTEITFGATLGHTLDDKWEFSIVHNTTPVNDNYGDGAFVGADGKTVTLATPLPFGTTTVYVQYTQVNISGGGANTQTDTFVKYRTQQVSVDPADGPIADVEGVWLETDPDKVGINYYIDGSFSGNTITLGTVTETSPTDSVIIGFWQYESSNKGLKPYANVVVPEDRVARARDVTVEEI